jgi:hypothetical protein
MADQVGGRGPESRFSNRYLRRHQQHHTVSWLRGCKAREPDSEILTGSRTRESCSCRFRAHEWTSHTKQLLFLTHRSRSDVNADQPAGRVPESWWLYSNLRRHHQHHSLLAAWLQNSPVQSAPPWNGTYISVTFPLVQSTPSHVAAGELVQVVRTLPPGSRASFPASRMRTVSPPSSAKRFPFPGLASLGRSS